jgi:lysophospholipase L1-like esterase
VGSSSIRGWRTLAQDFPDLQVIGRGFGGSSTIDVIRFADVLVVKHRPRIVVFYCGENDLTARATKPEDVFRHFRTFVDLVHRELPQTRILYISMKPSPSRLALIDRFREGNRLIRDYIDTDPRLRYIDVFSPMLDLQGKPRAELFVGDQLHMNPGGYALWTELVRPHLRD